MKFHVVTGLPITGSTLLQNILNQNPRFRCSSTSSLPSVIGSMSKAWSVSDEIKSDLINNKEHTEEKMRMCLRGAIATWSALKVDEQVAFDKSRFWLTYPRLLQWIDPGIKMIVCVRDLRSILAAIEKNHAATAVFDLAATPPDRTLLARAARLAAPDDMLGACVAGVEDLMRRAQPGSALADAVHVVRYEDLVAHPAAEMMKLYEELGEDLFEHNFKDVENTADDVDAIHNFKFPHLGCGKVEKREPSWPKWISPDVAAMLLNTFPIYNAAFGYKA